MITLAADVAAMTPGTNIGAAHPVAVGEQPDKVMQEKLVNDAAYLVEQSGPLLWVFAAIAVHTALHGVHEHASSLRGLTYTRREPGIGRRLAVSIADKFHSAQVGFMVPLAAIVYITWAATLNLRAGAAPAAK